MHLSRLLSKSLLVAALALAPISSSFAGVFVSVDIAPPELPVYEQPPCPDDGYLWTPGYWGYGDYGYYWIPGVWIQPPRFGVLWTPGYWGWGGGGYAFHGGYWGEHVGFYGGINYGFGYGGSGYGGGRWEGNRFAYNTAVNRVNVTNIHNTYVDRTVMNNNSAHTSFNGGTGGVQAQPTAQERQYDSEKHTPPTSTQLAHRTAASHDRSQLASANGGKPATLATTRTSDYRKVATQHPVTAQDKVKTNGEAAETPHTETEKPATETEKPKTDMEKKAPADTEATHETHPAGTAETEPETHHKSATSDHAVTPQHHATSHPKPKPQGHPKEKKQGN